MKKVVRLVTKMVYRHVAKPLLFRRHPDKVHADIIKLGKIVQRTSGVRAMPKIWSHDDKGMLSQVINDVTFRNPVGLAAGFDKNIELAPLMKSIGFGFMTGGSISAEACDGNPRPWFYRLPASKSLVVHAGLPNGGVSTVIRTISNYSRHVFTNFPLIVSVAKTNSKKTVDTAAAVEDYLVSLRELERVGTVAMYEINISCPNTHGGEPFTTPDRLEMLLSEIDALKLKRPVFLKMSLNNPWVEFEKLLEVAARHDVRGVTIGNLLKSREGIQPKNALPDSVLGNLSGLPTKKIATDLIRKTYLAYGKRFVIIGVGGVFSAEDAYEKICAGASLIGVLSGLIFEGPQLVGEINSGLVALLKADGFSHIQQAIGSTPEPKGV